MRNTNKRIWELRKEILLQRATAVGKVALGTVTVPLEIISHLNPLYWVYKVATYDPRTREIETMDYFDEAKESIANANQYKEELKTAKVERQEKKEQEVQEIINGNSESKEVLDYANNLMNKLQSLSVKEQKAYMVRIQRILAQYAYKVKELEECPNEIYTLNEKTLKRLTIIEEDLNITLVAKGLPLVTEEQKLEKKVSTK